MLVHLLLHAQLLRSDLMTQKRLALTPWRCSVCRTVYTNTARVYQANFPVTDGSTAGVNGGTPVIYRRQVKIPPLWNFQTSGECPRPTYKAPPGTGIFYTNVSPISAVWSFLLSDPLS